MGVEEPCLMLTEVLPVFVCVCVCVLFVVVLCVQRGVEWIFNRQQGLHRRLPVWPGPALGNCIVHP
jgi:hypothetical protein